MDEQRLRSRQPQGQPAAHVLPSRDNNMVWQRHTRWSLGGAVRRLKVHDGIVKEVLALELLRRKQVRLALKVAHKEGSEAPQCGRTRSRACLPWSTSETADDLPSSAPICS